MPQKIESVGSPDTTTKPFPSTPYPLQISFLPSPYTFKDKIYLTKKYTRANPTQSSHLILCFLFSNNLPNGVLVIWKLTPLKATRTSQCN